MGTKHRWSNGKIDGRLEERVTSMVTAGMSQERICWILNLRPEQVRRLASNTPIRFARCPTCGGLVKVDKPCAICRLM